LNLINYISDELFDPLKSKEIIALLKTFPVHGMQKKKWFASWAQSTGYKPTTQEYQEVLNSGW
jgi:hypothetical protein